MYNAFTWVHLQYFISFLIMYNWSSCACSLALGEGVLITVLEFVCKCCSDIRLFVREMQDYTASKTFVNGVSGLSIWTW